jgi:pimeloyl-ACP methyl ester carboxylesterase
MEGIDTRRVPTTGPTISVRDRPGGEPAILALHGLASNARWWDLVGADLAPAHRVLAADLRGHGQSDRTERGYDFDTVVDDLGQVLDVLDPRPVVVAGHSWGASVALAFAAAMPARALGVVCVDGGATDLKAYFGPSWKVAKKTMRPPDLRGITPEALRNWMDASPMSEGSDPETAAQILRGNFEDDGIGHLRPHLRVEQHMQIARHLFDLDGYELMSRVRCPVLFIPAGRPDHEDTPKIHAIEHAQSVLGDRARVVWIDGIHDLPVQRPHEVAAAIAEFVGDLNQA